MGSHHGHRPDRLGRQLLSHSAIPARRVPAVGFGASCAASRSSAPRSNEVTAARIVVVEVRRARNPERGRLLRARLRRRPVACVEHCRNADGHVGRRDDAAGVAPSPRETSVAVAGRRCGRLRRGLHHAARRRRTDRSARSGCLTGCDGALVRRLRAHQAMVGRPTRPVHGIVAAHRGGPGPRAFRHGLRRTPAPDGRGDHYRSRLRRRHCDRPRLRGVVHRAPPSARGQGGTGRASEPRHRCRPRNARRLRALRNPPGRRRRARPRRRPPR